MLKKKGNFHGNLRLNNLISSIRLLKLQQEEPPSLTLFLAEVAMVSAAFINSVLLSSINSLTIFSTVTLSQVSFMSRPSFQTWLTNLLFICWSAKHGQQIIGTPATILSSVEFPPTKGQKPTHGWVLQDFFLWSPANYITSIFYPFQEFFRSLTLFVCSDKGICS